MDSIEDTGKTTTTATTEDSILNPGFCHEECAIKVIDYPAIDLTKVHRKSSTIELQTAEGGTFSMKKVQEDNPENEYDLIPGKYEGISTMTALCIVGYLMFDLLHVGGSKIWECSLDLAQYIMLHPSGGSVLELGCGEGTLLLCRHCLSYTVFMFDR